MHRLCFGIEAFDCTNLCLEGIKWKERSSYFFVEKYGHEPWRIDSNDTELQTYFRMSVIDQYNQVLSNFS